MKLKDGVESDPAVVGFDRSRLENVASLVAARGGASWLVVLRDGDVVLDRTNGCDRDALFYTFSVSKPFVALAIHLLAQRKLLKLMTRSPPTGPSTRIAARMRSRSGMF